MATKIDIGLDLGTTNCTIGRLDAGGRPSVLGPIPSVGAWRNETVVFGDPAKKLLLEGGHDIFPIRDLKLLLGRADAHAGLVRISATELATELMRYLLSQILPEQTLIGTAVIGTPVQMPRAHRVALRQAAQQAGIENVRFIYEPTAALIGELDAGSSVEERSLILVVDWGGGTLDIAVVRVEEGIYRELSVGGDIRAFGGTQIDEEITNRILQKYPQVERKVRETRGMFDRLKEEIEQEKIEIVLEGPEAAPREIVPEWLEEFVEIEAPLVFDVLEKFVLGAREQIKSTLNAAHLRTEEITHILFAGGVCKAEIARKGLLELFPDAKIIQGRDQQLLTGYGCTLLTGRDFSVELAADFAVRQSDDTLCILLPKGQPVELDCYRKANFLVTDAMAPEAVFDLGVCHFDEDKSSMLATEASTFQSHQQMWVRVGGPQTKGGKGIVDEVILHTGVEGNLTVAVHLRSCNGDAEKQNFISGVPLAVRLNGHTRAR
jgi:molecular chaperone DnaK